MLRIFTPSDHVITAWKSGQGTTAEIARQPQGPAGDFDFDWRISIAGVTANGAFSAFPGIERTIIAISGAGLVLTVGDAAPHRLLPLEPYGFDGGSAACGELINGPVRDFNVMVRRGVWASQTEVWRGGHIKVAPAQRQVVLAYAVTGNWRVVDGANSCTLAAGDSLMARSGDICELRSMAAGDVLALVMLTEQDVTMVATGLASSPL